MEILREIFRVVTAKSDVSKSFPELDAIKGSDLYNSLTAVFLRGLRDDSWEDDEQAATALYGTNPGDQRYRTLKSRMQERLLQCLANVQIKQPEHSEFISAYYKCYRNRFCVETLMRFGTRQAGHALALKTLTIARKYQFTEICLSLASHLRSTSAMWRRTGDFRKYNKLVREYIDLLGAEHDASDILLRAMTIDTANLRTRNSAFMFIEQAFMEMDEILKKYQSHSICLNHFRLHLTYCEVQNDYNKTIEVCDSALAYLKLHPHLSQRARVGEFMLRKMLACIYLRRYDEASQLSERCIGHFSVGGNNWFVALSFAFVAECNRSNYETAHTLYVKATQNEWFVSHNEFYIRERWIIYYAYLVLAQKLRLMDTELLESKHFRLSSYLNSLPEESKDKQVLNVLILISHAFFLILDDEFDAAERRLEYLKVYTTRYLKEKEYHRVRIFIRLLYNLSRYSFDPVRAAKGNAKNFQLLRESANDPMPSDANEIIPFEIMYERLIAYLDTGDV